MQQPIAPSADAQTRLSAPELPTTSPPSGGPEVREMDDKEEEQDPTTKQSQSRFDPNGFPHPPSAPGRPPPATIENVAHLLRARRLRLPLQRHQEANRAQPRGRQGRLHERGRELRHPPRLRHRLAVPVRRRGGGEEPLQPRRGLDRLEALGRQGPPARAVRHDHRGRRLPGRPQGDASQALDAQRDEGGTRDGAVPSARRPDAPGRPGHRQDELDRRAASRRASSATTASCSTTTWTGRTRTRSSTPSRTTSSRSAS